MRRRIGFENSKIQKKRRKEIQGVGMGSGAEAPPTLDLDPALSGWTGLCGRPP